MNIVLKLVFVLACILGPIVLETHAMRTPDAFIDPVYALVIRIVAAWLAVAAVAWSVSYEVRHGMHHTKPGIAQKTALRKVSFFSCVLVPWIIGSDNGRALFEIHHGDIFAARMIGLAAFAVLVVLGNKLIDRQMRREAAKRLPQWYAEHGMRLDTAASAEGF